MLDWRRSDLLHGGARLLAEDLENALDTRLPEGPQAPTDRADQRLGTTHGQSLDDICAATEATVHENRHTPGFQVEDSGIIA
jgi:hypothetical protein